MKNALFHVSYFEALAQGKEIVVVSADPNQNSAVFWYRDGKIWTFSKEFGIFPRTIKEFKINKHLHDMEKEGAKIFIRGYYEP